VETVAECCPEESNLIALCAHNHPLAASLFGVIVTFLVLFFLTWWKLGSGSYELDPLGEDKAFEPHLKRYQDLAKLIITLATASAAFLFSFLVNHGSSSIPENPFARLLVTEAPFAIICLCLSVFLLLSFILLENYIYESYCHTPKAKRDVYKGWVYAIVVSVGWTGFLFFVFAFGYIAFKVLR
jgi:hypothetical protein